MISLRRRSRPEPTDDAADSGASTWLMIGLLPLMLLGGWLAHFV
ncbi:hypothetical protein [Deinococcus irradiatisoli]|nr:hypothetical protein [Deinococcus irradiatisoli]